MELLWATTENKNKLEACVMFIHMSLWELDDKI